MKKIIIIGSSIAGSYAACLLAGPCDVTVYEQKSKKDIGKKLCANVVTPTFLECIKKIELNPKKYIISEFSKANFFSKSNKVSLKTREFKIDRTKLVPDMINLAQKRGAKFVFNTEFADFERKDDGLKVSLSKNKKEIFDACDILIGADGALSNVAKKAGLWDKREFLLVVHTEVPVRKLKLEKENYYIYAGSKKGYYSYIFPSKGKAVIGIGDRPERVKEEYKSFLKFLKVKGGKVMAAMIPQPKIVHFQKNLFLIGDAGCYVKFSGGGIIPAMISAEGAKDVILNRDFRKIKELNKRTFINRIATKTMFKMGDKDYDELLEVFKSKQYGDILEKRDKLGKKEYLSLINLKILKFLLKLL